MIKLVFALAFFIFSLVSYAKCGGPSISIFPAKEMISKNPIIILQLYLLKAQTLDVEGKEYPVYLRSGSQKISLIVSQVLAGEFNLMQIVLKPSVELTAGKKYELVIDMKKKGKVSILFRNQILKHKNPSWLVENVIDNSSPSWKNIPRFSSKSHDEFGCGPAKFINFDFDSDETEAYIKTTVKSIKTGEQTSFFLFADDKILKVGHGMCSGAFHFKRGKYEVIFELFDSSGNSNNQTTKVYRFSSPTSKD